MITKTEILNIMKMQLLVKIIIIFIKTCIYSYTKKIDNNDDCDNK